MIQRAAFLVVVLALLAACAESARSLRQVMEPPGFAQLQNDEIRTSMHVMAAHAMALDVALREEQDTIAQQQKVLAALDGIFAAAHDVRPAGSTSSHPMLDKRMPLFLRDVESARAAAAATPPSYFLAGSVAGSCAACHRDTQR